MTLSLTKCIQRFRISLENCTEEKVSQENISLLKCERINKKGKGNYIHSHTFVLSTSSDTYRYRFYLSNPQETTDISETNSKIT